MKELIDKFLRYLSLELNSSAHTVAAYRGDLELLAAHLQSQGVASFSTAGVAHLRSWLVELNRRGDSARTVRRRVQAARALYKWLERSGDARSNPAARLELARLPKRLPQSVRQRQLDSLLDEPLDESDFEAVRNRLIVMMLYEAGLRRAELIGLLDANVDTSKRELRVLGKRDKERIVPFGDELAHAIDNYRRVRDTAAGGPTHHFFVRPTGEQLYPTLVYKVVTTQLRHAGITGKASPHTLRHSFASAMLNNGAEINNVKELLGHESLAATQVYTHITFSEMLNNYKLAHPRALRKE